MKKLIIAIDGYSSCGKSTFAKAIAEYLGYMYLDSGAMYRAFTFLCLKNDAVSEDGVNQEKITGLLKKVNIQFKYNVKTGKSETFLNGENVEKEIRTIEVANAVSMVSKTKKVRKIMVSLQREIGSRKGVVMDGRDIGTVVFPEADIKIFMTADIDVRAERRYKENIEKNIPTDYSEIKKNIQNRDNIDENRDESPLKKAEDAHVLDNSNMTLKEQMEWFKRLI